MVGGYAPPVSLAVADEHPIGQRIQFVHLTEIGRQLHGVAVDRTEIAVVGRCVVAYHGPALVGMPCGLAALKRDMRVVGALAACARPRMPPSPVPGQQLGDALRPYNRVYRHFHAGLVP